MKLWKALYAMIWLVFLEIWLAFTSIIPPLPYYAHLGVGFAVVGGAYRNFAALRATEAPDASSGSLERRSASRSS